ncbi:carboxypeptidase-like regulatory domain-containing protein [Chryseolinea lacunae]|uniref:Carboxypeptidase-like regulatory domain-containing protein n=1 Tax=Chryseolinea lacunae TaxID=2801331 RepID=A0ABS1KQ15_9BACT|nr:carboxypeptidase-like regulatory domain-containing protein [Chryseolinea lacunae]MBL0740782.1 carboxypeptidase-like regulatory domain-containing protein [Chryseolinea lacunae]
MHRVCIGMILHIFLGHAVARAQTSGIRGSVTDQGTQQPLPYASVYINLTTQGTYTNERGEFVLTLSPGPHEVIVSFVGYQPFQTRVNVNAGEFTDLAVSLKAAVLKEMVVSGTKDTQWQRQLGRFTKLFMGTGPSASQCKILNPYSLEFTDEKGVFYAKSSVPLEIENLYLGYRVYYDLRNFMVGPTHYLIAGYVRFAEIETIDSLLEKKWRKNRDAVYKGSSRHLLKALVTGKVKEEAFEVYQDNSTAIAVRNANFMGNVDRLVTIYNTDSIVSPGKAPGWYAVKLPPRLEVHYVHKPSVAKVYRDVPYPVSWIDVKGGSLEVNAEGILANSLKMVVSGAMGDSRIAEILPNDYVPDATTEHHRKIVPRTIGQLAVLAEKPYLHTDRSYYYPGDVIWFKAHMQYYSPSMRDSLSRVLYVDLVDAEKKIVMTRVFPLSRDGGVGHLELPQALPRGNYQLRAYTRWMLNFDRAFVFVKPVQILADNEWVRPADRNPDQTSDNIVLTTDKDHYKTREKISMTLQVMPADVPLTTLLSVSVTDLDQAVPARNETTILAAHLPTVSLPDTLARKNMHTIQYGIDVKGHVTNPQGKAVQGVLTFVQKNANDAFVVKTDEAGNFYVPDLLVYDTAKLLVQPKTVGGRFGKIALDSVVLSPPVQSAEALHLDIQRDAVSHHRYKQDRPAKILEEIVVSTARAPNEKRVSLATPDALVDGTYFRSGAFADIILALQSKVAGLRIITIIGPDAWPRRYILFGAASSLGSLEAQEPIVLVDGVMLNSGMGGTVEQISKIDPNEIDRVEVTKFGNGAAYGARGGNGVIAIFTRNKYDERTGKKPLPYNKEKLVPLNIQGYASPLSFRGRDHATEDASAVPDYRATLYWNPEVALDEHNQTRITFYAADLETRYRVVVEGLTADGVPLRAEKIIVVKLP